MDEEIYEKLNKIEALEDKVLLKNILNGVFSEIKNYTDEKVQKLEDRVFEEVKYSKEKYNIYSCLRKRESIDITNSFFFPMIKADLNEEEYEVKDIMDALKNEKEIMITKIFMENSFTVFKEFLDKNLTFKGIIETDKRKHEAYFKVKKNEDYEECISDLYECFINNNIPWTTINNPYIHKFAKVYLESIKDSLEPDESIEKIQIDFGEYSEFIKYNMVPLWNIKELTLKGNGFPVPCKDKINYEHTISLSKEGKENGYLVKTSEDEINYVMFREEAIIVSAKEYTPKKWQILKITAPNEDMNCNFEYPVMNNGINLNFTNKLLFSNRQNVKTKAELARVINSYNTSHYLKFNEVKIEEQKDGKEPESYEVNEFIEDEIRDLSVQKNMILYFQPLNKENYLNQDILSFLVSEVQLIFPEYRCGGRLI